MSRSMRSKFTPNNPFTAARSLLTCLVLFALALGFGAWSDEQNSETLSLIGFILLCCSGFAGFVTFVLGMGELSDWIAARLNHHPQDHARHE